jgi:hypothetical protein
VERKTGLEGEKERGRVASGFGEGEEATKRAQRGGACCTQGRCGSKGGNGGRAVGRMEVAAATGELAAEDRL